MGEVSQAGDVVVGEVQVDQLGQVRETLQVLFDIFAFIVHPPPTYCYLFDAVLM